MIYQWFTLQCFLWKLPFGKVYQNKPISSDNRLVEQGPSLESSRIHNVSHNASRENPEIILLRSNKKHRWLWATAGPLLMSAPQWPSLSILLRFRESSTPWNWGVQHWLRNQLSVQGIKQNVFGERKEKTFKNIPMGYMKLYIYIYIHMCVLYIYIYIYMIFTYKMLGVFQWVLPHQLASKNGLLKIPQVWPQVWFCHPYSYSESMFVDHAWLTMSWMRVLEGWKIGRSTLAILAMLQVKLQIPLLHDISEQLILMNVNIPTFNWGYDIHSQKESMFGQSNLSHPHR